MFHHIGKAADSLIKKTAAKRDLMPLARQMAQILVAEGTDLADEREVEAVIRKFHPVDLAGEIDLLVELCPDIARSRKAAINLEKGTL